MTNLLPKPLLPIGGRPILATLLSGLGETGLGDVGIVVGHLGGCIRDFVGDGKSFGVRVSYYEQPEPLGTGDAVARAVEFIDDTTMIIAGDTGFLQAHIAGLADFHRDHAADVSLCLKRLPPEGFAATNSVQLAEGGEVTEFIEKPAPGAEIGELAAALLHVYPPGVVDYLSRLGVSERGEYELTAVLNMMIDDGLAVFGKEFPVAPHVTDWSDFLRLNFDYAAALMAKQEDE